MEQISSSSTSPQPLRVLSFDGGGIRGMSSLHILGDIMEKTREARRLDKTPRPCEHFDLIGGTSTGGIIAIMLGRLGMTVDECITAYRKVAEQAFTPKRTSIFPAPPTGSFSAKALEAAIKQTVREFCAEEKCVERRSQGLTTVETCLHSDVEFRSGACTKTAVLAITKDNVDTLPTLFTTYDTSAAFHGCTIWQVARATSAATTFFKSIKVGRYEIEFIDAGFGYNNPCEVLIEEAKRQFPGRERMQVLSIGAGLGDVVSIQNTRRSILDALKKMATSSKRVAASLDSRYGDTGQYYRLNVDKGLEDITLSDWKKASTISAHTHNYLQENKRTVTKLVNNFLTTGQNGSSRDISQARHVTAVGGGTEPQELPPNLALVRTESGNTPQAMPVAASHESAAAMSELYGTTGYSPLPCHYIPLPENGHFVGRDATLNDLRGKLFGQKRSRKVAIVGLGGIGKTQVALQVAYWAKKNRPQYSILWVPALSDATFEQACTEIAKKLGIRRADHNDVKDTVRRYLSSEKAGPWLLVVDNADDMDVVVGNADGPGIIDYLPDSEHGMILLTTRFTAVANSVAEGDVIELGDMDYQEAQELLGKWLRRKSLLSNNAATTELLRELVCLPLAITQAAAYLNRNQISVAEGTGNAVATTWLVSFDQIRKSDTMAANLLMFMSHIEPKAIPRPFLPSTESEEEIVHAIGTLCAYAFLSRRGESAVYDMHSLVHLATRVWIQKHGLVGEATAKAMRHVAKVFPSDDYENRNVWREYMPHMLKLVQGSTECDIEERYDLYFWAGRCLQVDGRIREAVECLERCCFWREETLADDHPDRLASQHELAIAYRANGEVSKAVKLLEHVVAIREKTLADDHLDRLASQHTLAIAYRTNGEVPKAVKLLEHVVAIHEKMLADDHPDRLASLHELAGAYRANGEVPKAVKLLEHVVAIREKTLADDHPDRLASQHALAIAYQANGEVSKAVKLLEYVVAIREEALANDHPDQLTSQHILAIAYRANGEVPKAVKLLEHVVATREKILADDHPDWLASQHTLAIVYQANGEVSKAIKLLEHVVAIRKKTLADDHPSRLASQRALAIAYQANGEVPKAVKLLEHVVAIHEKTLANDHPDRLASQYKLAIAYRANGKVPKAIKLLEHVVAIHKKMLADDHLDRLASQHALAIAYQANGEVPKAVKLLEHVVAIHEKTLADDHPDWLASHYELAIAYQANGKVPKAVKLLEHVVAIHEKTLADDHPDRLASQGWLAYLL